MTRIAYRTPQTTNQECDALDMQQDRREISSRINIGKEVWYLTQEEVIAAGVTEQDILRLTLAALVAHGRKEYEMPAKIGVHPHQEVFFHAMPAYVPGRLALGMKWIECYPNNPGKFNLPQTTGLLILNDPLRAAPSQSWIASRSPRCVHPPSRSCPQAPCIPRPKLSACSGAACRGWSTLSTLCTPSSN